MARRVLKLRHPNLNFIPYAGILCFLASFLSFPFIVFDPSKKELHLNFTDFTIYACFIGFFFFALTIVPAIIFLNVYWREFLFDSERKIVAIKRKIFFFPIGAVEEIPCNVFSLRLEHRFLFSSSYSGAGSGYVWHLILDTGYHQYDVGFSLLKGRIEKLKTRIEFEMKIP